MWPGCKGSALNECSHLQSAADAAQQLRAAGAAGRRGRAGGGHRRGPAEGRALAPGRRAGHAAEQRSPAARPFTSEGACRACDVC